MNLSENFLGGNGQKSILVSSSSPRYPSDNDIPPKRSGFFFEKVEPHKIPELLLKILILK